MRSEEHTSELQSRFGISYAVFCLKKKTEAPTLDRHMNEPRQSASLHQQRRNPRDGAVRLTVLPTLHALRASPLCFFFFFNDTATTEIYTLSLHDALPISRLSRALLPPARRPDPGAGRVA